MADARFFVEGGVCHVSDNRGNDNVPAPGEACTGREWELPDAVAHHAVRVLRLGVGDTLTLFDGAGGEFAATLVAIAKRAARVRIDGFDPVERESALHVTLVQAIAANDAMDYAVRKAVELGVAVIAPVITARSAPLRLGERAERRRQHWQHIAIAACEQCGRNRVPVVATTSPLRSWLSGWRGAAYVCAPRSNAGASAIDAPDGTVAVVIGPEGGLSDEEMQLLQAANVRPLSLGPRILRTETAVVVALTLIQERGGDLS